MTFEELENKVNSEMVRFAMLKPSQSNAVEWVRLHKWLDEYLSPYIKWIHQKAFGQMTIGQKK